MYTCVSGSGCMDEDNRIKSFYWPVKVEDMETNEDGRPILSLNFTSSRWVPRTKVSAIKWLLKHPNAAALREHDGTYIVAKCVLGLTWDERYAEVEEIPEMPEDWIEPPIVYDQIDEENPPQETIDDYDGHLLPKNFKHTLVVGRITPDLIVSINTKEIKSLKVSMMSPEDIIAMSAVEVFEDEIFAQSRGDETPLEHGPMDRRMGSIDSGDECYTCGWSYQEHSTIDSCLGHFGHILLAAPVPNYLFLQGGGYTGSNSSPLHFTANVVCHHCNEIRATDEQLQGIEFAIDTIARKERNDFGYQQIRNMVKKVVNSNNTDADKQKKLLACPRCDERSFQIEWNHQYQRWLIKTPKRFRDSDASNIEMGPMYELLENIPSNQHKFLGFFGDSKPQHMYWSVIPVAPNIARPLAYSDEGTPEPNDLTLLYQNIVFSNNRLIRRMQTNAAPSAIANFERQLYRACTHLVTSNNAALGAGGARTVRDRRGRTKTQAYKGLLDRLTGGKRKSRMRSVIQSKVVNQVSYSVVTPSPDLAIDEVGVPYGICAKATVYETVTAENIDHLQQMVLEGPKDNGNYIKEYEPFAYAVVQGGFTKTEVSKHSAFRRNIKSWEWGDERVEEAWREYKIENEINLRGVEQSLIDKYRDEYLVQYNREFRLENLKLKIGDSVERTLKRGDIGLFNRAPSLHRQSVQGMKVVPMAQKSLSFNPTICIPFNADYDGDAMKLHFVQSPEAIEEAKEKMMLGKNIIHARYGKLTIATDQDQTTGLAILTMPIATRKGEYNLGTGYTHDEGIPYFNRTRVINLLSASWHKNDDGSMDYKTELPEPDYEINGKRYWTGRAVVSHFLPDFLNATFKGNNPERDEKGLIVRKTGNEQIYNGTFKQKEVKEVVEIRNGVLLKGTLDKTAFGEGGASIAPAFFYHYGYDKGQEEMKKFIHQITRLAFEAHKQIVYTITPTDCSLSDLDVRDTIKDEYDKVSNQIIKIQRAYDARKLHELPNLSAFDYDQILKDPLSWAEGEMVSLANEYESYVTDYVSDASGPQNPIQIAVRSKARGKATNIQQMSGTYGQMKYGGRRPIWGVNPDRTMVHYPLPGYEPEHPRHKGFVLNCYGTGLEPDEYWLTSTAGRRSAAESSTGAIAKSGHLEYKVKRSVEDVVVGKGNNAIDVRDGTIVSFNLGGDGLRPFHIRGQGHDTLSPDGRYITLQPLLFEFKCKHGLTLMDECSDCSKGLNVDYIFEELAYAHSSASKLASFIDGRDILKPEANKLIEKFNWWFAESQCELGEGIGATAAACLGEPVTQAGLRTFHGGGKFSTQGSVEGIERVVQVSKSGNPDAETIVFLKDKYDMKDAEAIALFCTRSFLQEYITSVDYKDDTSLLVAVDPKHITRQQVDRSFVERQLTRIMSKEGFELTKGIQDSDEFILTMQNPDPRKLLLARDKLMGIQVSGLSNADFAVAQEPKEDGLGAGLYRIRIRGPTHSGSSAVLWDEIHELLEKYIEPTLTWTSEFWVVYKKLGLEAMLSCIYEQIDIQMNGDNGLGEYDHRYIRILTDRIGQKGFPVGLQPNTGWGGGHSRSFVGSVAGEGIIPKISSGAVMSATDNLRGMVEAVTTGNLARLGKYVLDENR
ncbi:MAG: hypothetical protein CMP53_09185 [Flavobacteriales bacterium]|nr:hypothetical protein [Flavobacteriales bacterium]